MHSLPDHPHYRLQQGDDLLLVEVSWLGLRLVEGSFQLYQSRISRNLSLMLGQMAVRFLARLCPWEEAPSRYPMPRQSSMPWPGVIIWYLTLPICCAMAAYRGHRHAAVSLGSKIFSPNTSRLGRQMERLEWSATIGLGDAAATAILAECNSRPKGSRICLAAAQSPSGSGKVRWQVTPNYSGLWLEVTIYCIFRVNAGHIIIMGIGDYVRSLFQRWAWWKKHLGETYSR